LGQRFFLAFAAWAEPSDWVAAKLVPPKATSSARKARTIAGGSGERLSIKSSVSGRPLVGALGTRDALRTKARSRKFEPSAKLDKCLRRRESPRLRQRVAGTVQLPGRVLSTALPPLNDERAARRAALSSLEQPWTYHGRLL
jgi:hypothetical protein